VSVKKLVLDEAVVCDVTASDLILLGFDRSWTIDTIRFSSWFNDSNTENCEEICNMFVKYECHDKLKELTIEVDGTDYDLEDLLPVIKVFYNVEVLRLASNDDHAETNTRVNTIDYFAQLSRLKKLALVSVEIGFEYSELSVLSNLEDLTLSDCIDVENFDDVAQLSKLRKLHLSQNSGFKNASSVSRLVDLNQLLFHSFGELDLNLNHLSGLTKLTELELRSYHIEGAIDSLSQLTKMERLIFISHWIGSGNISVLKNFKNLREFSIETLNYGDTPMSRLLYGDLGEALPYCSKLERLNLRNLPLLKGNVEQWAHLINLKDFSGRGLDGINGDIFSFLSQSKCIEYIDIGYCDGLTGNLSSLSDLKHIKCLHIRDCEQLEGDPSFLTTNSKVIIRGCPRMDDIDNKNTDKVQYQHG
jgi:hypothetical protein